MATADEDRITLRQSQALSLRIKGYSFREIADELKISLGLAHSDVRSAMSGTLKRTQDELDAERELELHRCDVGLRVVAKILDDETLDEGSDLKLKALDRQVKLQEQRSKLLGLYAPTKVEAEVNAVGLDEIDALRKAAAANGCLPPSTTDSNEPSS